MVAATMAGGGPPKTVLITGVSRGLGRALTLELARRGHTIIGCSRSEDKIQALQDELQLPSDAPPVASSSSSSSSSSSKHLLSAIDVRSDESVKEFAKLVAQAKRVPDIIVNNAGTINKNNKIWEVPGEEFDMVIDTNLKGVANILRHFLPLMIERKKGIIVNMSSGWGRSPAAEVAPYCASKWAIEGLSRSVAKELPPGLAIVALSPGVVNTEMLASCFGSSAALYQSPEAWAPKAATMILNLTEDDNGASLTV
ncbi:NADPH-dependent pterin aldehyde reductase [Dioscorea cayenensis subsp. rotundata]|uniref:NADPH-dependent pterin aldehyde reductase n=1 Tax=Dioscorea cayennensis subsp. rotundata TaxID=55577 RepID=A0AB40BZN0_DIOCR|nr:NADPH-dependent pterin aldehyde reductase [Dioscorea cayenensis subsp. rotundata]